ncbi:metallophosphoesterase [Nocardioides sp.]|uniref:metallophosphoesterase family protein n=1 Tax=Nocardioides sp. TaxID=35761 RepID=UPI0035630A68
MSASESTGRVLLGHTLRLSRIALFVAVWAALAAMAATVLFFVSSRTVVLASHDAVVRPALHGQMVISTGPVLPDLRMSTDRRLGVDISLGKTDARSTEELVKRYAYIASQPEGQVAKVEKAMLDMAFDAALRGAALGLLPILVWLVLGSARRRELVRRSWSRQGALAALLVVALTLALWQPWDRQRALVADEKEWIPLAELLGPEITIPAELDRVEVRGDVTTRQSQRLIDSAIATYDKSQKFYTRAAEAAAELNLREPEEDETVVVLVSDRHDNIGMDAVARAIGDAGGATAVFNAGDDTSTGARWEAFSLDSVDEAFADLDRFGVAGNHDHGGFVHDYLSDLGWTMLDGQVVDGPGDTTLLGVDDPRSSGLGSWRDETGLSFDEVGSRLADAACEADERVTTILVHDSDLGTEALERGCVDLVLAGHVHVQVGPVRVMGADGKAGYTYTTGTTGGAAYAIAVGSKPRRTAQVSLVTYRDSRPVGIQPVLLQTNGVFEVGEFIPLYLSPNEGSPEGDESPEGSALRSRHGHDR